MTEFTLNSSILQSQSIISLNDHLTLIITYSSFNKLALIYFHNNFNMKAEDNAFFATQINQNNPEPEIESPSKDSSEITPERTVQVQ